jgi:hypothetical protein
MGVFKTTPVETLHNLTCILPLPYVLKKLTHAYALCLQNLPANSRVQTILSEDWCRYWPDYIQPATLLMCIFSHTHTHYPRVEGQDLTDLRNTPRFTYLPNPSALQLKHYKHQLRMCEPPYLHILISATIHNNSHITMYQSTISSSTTQGRNRMQALSRAVYTAFWDAAPRFPPTTIIWI